MESIFPSSQNTGVNGGEPRSTDFPSILSEPLGGPTASTQCLGKESKSFCPLAPSILGNGVCAQPGFNSPEKWTEVLRPCSLENTVERAHTQAGLRERGESPSRFGLLNALPGVGRGGPCSMVELPPALPALPALTLFVLFLYHLTSSPSMDPISVCACLCEHENAERIMAQMGPGW